MGPALALRSSSEAAADAAIPDIQGPTGNGWYPSSDLPAHSTPWIETTVSRQNSNGQTRRIRIIDIVRGVAVLGILTINLVDMAYPEDLALAFHLTDPERGWNYWTGLSLETIFSGKMRGLFTLLFGVSSILIVEKLSCRYDGPAVARIYFRRLFWLLMFGLLNAYVFLWWGDVLFKYALLGMLLYAFRQASFGVLTAAVLVCLTVLTVQPFADYRETANLQQDAMELRKQQESGERLTADDRDVIADWRDTRDDLWPDDELIEDEMEIKTGRYGEIFQYNAEYVLEEYTSVFYQEDLWDMMPYMLLGIMLLRMGFFDERTKQGVHFAIAFVGIGTGLATHAWMNLGLQENPLDPVNSFYYRIFFDLGRLPFVLGYLSLIIFVFRMPIFRRIGDGMSATGRMALSNYLMQSILAAFLLYGFGLGQFNQLRRLDLAMVIIVVWILQIGFSVFWMRRFHYGPFEWLWRSLTYWQAQSLRKT